MRRTRITVLLLGVVAMFAVGVPAAMAMPRLRPTAVTTAPDETTTEVPTTVAPTTVAPTTTEPAPTTTETATTEVTTTSAPTPSTTTTTTVPPPATSSGSSSTPWGWIIAILAVIAVGLIVVLVMLRRAAGKTKSEWKNAAASALRDADLTSDMLAGEARPGAAEDAARVNAVRDSVERVAAVFDGLANSAPNDEMRRNAIGASTSLRGYFFALEAEQMLHNAPTTPTAEQLASADATKRARATELEAALAQIRAYVAPTAPSR